ncbi:uncharacterized protein [Temnothorax nylanderi]|uniref:uncharacterized protein n=1 Tax=Temnothorax nylanderi TaxID=102681 RepID=UPI003A864AE5
MLLNREKTDFAENHYYRLNQILLSAVGLWPYQRSKFTIINHIFHFGIMGSFVFFQLTSFLTLQFTLDLCIMVLSYAVPGFSYIVQYCAFCVNRNAVKRIWKDIRDNWSLLKDETERDIMRQHSSFGELMTKLASLSVIISMILYAITELLPTILDLIFPINQTRPQELHASTEYFIDKTTYFYPIFCHWIISLLFGVSVIMATGLLEIIYIENICGLLRIASYRIEHSIDKYVSHNSAQKDCVAHQGIITAVDIHRRALECSEFMVNSFVPYFVLLIIIVVASTSLNLLRLLRAITSRNMYELLASTLFVGFHFLIMFIANYYGQKLTDYNNEIFNTAYNVKWYKAPIKMQKLLLFIMQSTTTPYVLNIGYLLSASVEGFSKVERGNIWYIWKNHRFLLTESI